MNLIILSQILLGFNYLILGSPLSPPSSSVALDVRRDIHCPSPDLGLCTLEVLVHMEWNAAIANLYYANCTACPENHLIEIGQGLEQWTPRCIKEKQMSITVDKNGELHPILWDGVEYNVSIVSNPNKDRVAYRANFACSTTSAAAAPTSAPSPTPSSGGGCGDLTKEPPLDSSCHYEWEVQHFPAAGSGHTGESG